MTLKEIKTRYFIIDNNNGGLSLIDQSHLFIGTIKQEKSKTYYIGLPDNEPILVKTLDDIQTCSEKFLQECEDKWIDPRALDQSSNSGYHADLALTYVANKLGWKTAGHFSEAYVVSSDAFGCRVLSIESRPDYTKNVTTFCVMYNNEWYSMSPEFSDYFSAMDWLRNLLSMTLTSVGAGFLSVVANNPNFFVDNAKIQDIVMSKIQLGGNGIAKQDMSLKEYVIDFLEKQLAKLKE